jgi:nicotinamidase-related amidase
VKHNDLEITRDLEEVIHPETTALLVYDMQVGIFEQAPTLRPVIESVASVIEACRAAGVRIFFCRHTSLPPNLMGRSQLRTAMAWQRVDSPEKVRSLFLRDSPNTALIPEATALPTEAVFDKLGMSAFAGTPLDMALRDCGITSVAIVGVVLEIGIGPTVSHAEDLGYVPVVIEDACGSVDPDARERVLAGMAGTLMSLTTDVATFRRLIEKTRVGPAS